MKRIFVNGNIIINTSKFHYKEITAYADFITNADEYLNGDIEYNDSNPQSIFNEYYASGEVTSFHLGVDYLFRNIDDVYFNFIDRISDIEEVIAFDKPNLKIEGIINRLLYVSIVAAMETFMCDALLVFIVNDEDMYNKAIFYFLQKSSEQERIKIQKFKEDKSIIELEQFVIEKIMRETFSNISIIKGLFKAIAGKSVKNTNGIMNGILYKRHLFAHKNGRKKDGGYILVSIDDLQTAIRDISFFVKNIYDSIK